MEWAYGRETVPRDAISLPDSRWDIWVVAFNQSSFPLNISSCGATMGKSLDRSRTLKKYDGPFVLHPQREERWGLDVLPGTDAIVWLTEKVRPYVVLEGRREIQGRAEYMVAERVRRDRSALNELAGVVSDPSVT
jgi:hypothetical protein